jgi:hypothetical protein
VKIYGHYALVDDDQITFYRYPIDTFSLNFHSGRDRKKAYDFTREVYSKFYPEHLDRIRRALSELDGPRERSSAPSVIVDEGESQGPDPSTSQEITGFKKPELPTSKKQKGEMGQLREQIAQQERIYKEQMGQMERLYKEQMAQQDMHYKEQMAQLEKQLSQQGEMLKQLLERR